jgi:hypothetical protein
MKRAWATFALVRADVLERTRRYQYLATIAGTLLVGTLLLPGRNAGYQTFLIDGYRGVYNSAWIGASCALLATMLLSLFGFYFVKDAVERDRTTRVGEIIATTPIGRFDYALGKVLSNFLVLASMTAILFVTAVVMQFVRGESASLDLGAIAAPFVLAALPAIATVAAVAVLFEMIPWLRGGLGNAIYFFGWMAYLIWSFQSNLKAPWWRDMLAGNLIVGQVWSALLRVDPSAKPSSIEIGATIGSTIRRSFTFQGFHWTLAAIGDRLMWFLVAACITAAAALCFDRFTRPARGVERRRSAVFTLRWQSALERITTPLLDAVCGSAFGAIVLAELRLLVRGLSAWWYLAAAGFWIFQLAADPKSQSLAVGLAWIWPLLVWSQVGTREHVFATEQLIYPTLHPIRRQFAAQWLAAVVLALLTASGSLIHSAITGNVAGIEGVVAGAIFVPSLALACGALSGTTRLFEIVYLVLWYVGPLNRTMFDFTAGANAPGFAVASLALLTVAVGARRLRLQYA